MQTIYSVEKEFDLSSIRQKYRLIKEVRNVGELVAKSDIYISKDTYDKLFASGANPDECRKFL